MTPSPSYNPKACCGSDCFRHPGDESGPCWGDVEVIDEESCGTDEEPDYYWVHGCQGHKDMWYQTNGLYRPEPPQPPPEGTLGRAIWDARGGPPPPPLMQGFA